MEQNGCIHVAGECNITVDGNTNIYARTDANIQVEQNATVKVGNVLEIGSANDTTLAVGGDLLVKVAGNFNVDANNMNLKSQSQANIQAVGELSVKGNSANIEAVGEMNILSGGVMNMDYSEGQFGNGAAGASDVEDVALTPPPAGNPLNSTIKYSEPPPRQFEEKAVIETPEDWETPEGRARANKTLQEEGVTPARCIS